MNPNESKRVQAIPSVRRLRSQRRVSKFLCNKIEFRNSCSNIQCPETPVQKDCAPGDGSQHSCATEVSSGTSAQKYNVPKRPLKKIAFRGHNSKLLKKTMSRNTRSKRLSDGSQHSWATKLSSGTSAQKIQCPKR